VISDIVLIALLCVLMLILFIISIDLFLMRRKIRIMGTSLTLNIAKLYMFQATEFEEIKRLMPNNSGKKTSLDGNWQQWDGGEQE
jgi:predicted Holliday junction resolvase-like endonuclease